MITLSSYDADLWKDVCARCIATEMAPSAAAKRADEAVQEFRKRLSEEDKAMIQQLEAKARDLVSGV